MKKSILFALTIALAPQLRAEGPADEVKAAAKKLAEAASYTWTTTTPGRDGGQGGSVEGKTEKGGPVTLKTTFGDRPPTESVVKAGKVAVKTDEGWKSGDELTAAGGGRGGADGGGGRGRGFGGGGFAARQALNTKAPAEEVEALATGSKDLKKDGDAIAGALSDEAAKARLSFGGGRRRGGDAGGGDAPPGPSNAKGTVKFWLKDGNIAKYEVTVEGTFEFNGNTRDIKRTATTEIKDVGSTKLEIPAEATAKLSGGDKPADKPAETKKDEETKKPQ